MSGYINEDILPEQINESDVAHLNFFCSHGSVDQVIPVEWARKTPEFLKAININHEYSEYPVGHGVAPQNFYDLKTWLDKYI